MVHLDTFTVQPHATRTEHRLELRPKSFHRDVQHFFDGRTIDDVLCSSCCFTRGGEQSQVSHDLIVVLPLPCLGMKFAPIRARFLVVRHGQSLWNIEQRWQGRADIDLSDHGIAQARAAASKLGGFDFIASSNLRRALDTAQIIAEHHGVGPVHVDERLRETHVGPWEGLTVHEIEERWPGFLAARRKPEGFESDESIMNRMTSALVDLSQHCADGTGMIVSHSGVIRTMRYILNVANPRLANLSGSWFFVHDDGTVTAGDVVSVIDEHDLGEAL